MTEGEIRKKAIAILEPNYVVWALQKVAPYQTDIFGVFDLIAIHRQFSDVIFIQLTTTSNASKRRRKISDWLNRNDLFDFKGAHLWHWNAAKNCFVNENIQMP